MNLRRFAAPVAVLAVLALAGCTPPAPAPTTPAPTVTSASPTPTPTVTAVAIPANCDAIIGPALAATFASRNIVLFDSTDNQGIYPDSNPVLAQDGGSPFFCLYGSDGVDLSTFVIEAQAVETQSEHEGIVAVLGSGALTQSVNGDVVTFEQVGDEMSVGTIIHVLRVGSWLTASSTFGGTTQAAHLTGYLDQIATNLGL